MGKGNKKTRNVAGRKENSSRRRGTVDPRSASQLTSNHSATSGFISLLAVVVAVVAIVVAVSKKYRTVPASSEDDEIIDFEWVLGDSSHRIGQGCHPKRQHLCSEEDLQKARLAHEHFERAKDLAKQGLTKEAINSYQTSLQIDNETPFASAASQNLGLLFAQQEEKEMAMAALLHAVRLDPESMYAHMSMANAFLIHQWELAEKHYQFALELVEKEEHTNESRYFMVVANTNYGSLLRRVSHRVANIDSTGRNVIKEARKRLERAFAIVKEGGATQDAASNTIIELQYVLRKEGDEASRNEVLEWGVLRGIWRDKRQWPRHFNHALYNIMPKPVSPWLQNPEDTPVLRRAKSVWREILSEYEAARSRGLQPVGKRVDRDTELFDGRGGQDWSEFPLFSEGKELDPDIAPVTTALFRKSVSPRGQLAFSVITPGTRIEPHCGPTNEMITCHLGLKIPDAPASVLGISVGAETRGWKEGEWICFEDSFEHEVWNNAQESRVVLLVNLIHPLLTQ